MRRAAYRPLTTRKHLEMPMEFRILGPLEVLDGDAPVKLPGPKQRSLLAMLVLHANEVVSSDRLIDELWPGEPPESGAAALQASVSRLRKSLGGGARRLETVAPGYVLHLDSQELDLRRFEQLVGEAERDEPAEAAERLRAALALWRGSPLADFAYEPFAQAAIGRLEELRLLALERRIDADLLSGRDAELVPELESLVAQHPLREGLREKLMVALYRAGRQAEALESYRSARRALVEGLGIEPGPALQELEKAILRQDPSLELAQAPPSIRSMLTAALGEAALEPVLALAEALARKSPREIIVARLLEAREDLGRASAALSAHCESLANRGLVARAAAFTSSSPGADAARLAAEQDVDLVLVPAPPELLGDSALGDLLTSAPCDVGVLVGRTVAEGPVLVPFGGAEHDWSAIELGAWLAGGWGTSLRLAGPAVEGGRDASRLLASASLAVQRALGVAAEPLLVDHGPGALAAAAQEAAVAVIGLSDRWRKDGLGPTRSALATSGRATLLVRRGLRPGGLAPVENLTRFTWSLRAG
jgi:DNA-binding SARP family transcriptional activator